MAAFGDEIKRWTVKSRRALGAVVDSSQIEISRRIQNRTPVDTGAARASWQPEYLGNIYLFTSNLPYIRRLEYGWSKQAPQGMVRISAAEFPDIVADAVKKYGSL